MSSNFKRVVFAMIFGSTVLLLVVDQAYAYLDPGTGSMFVQAVLAGIAAVSVTVGIFWQKLRNFFGQLFSKGREHGDDR